VPSTNKKQKKVQVKDAGSRGWAAHHFVYPTPSKKITPASFGVYPTDAGVQQNLKDQADVAAGRAKTSEQNAISAQFAGAASSGQILSGTANTPGIGIAAQNQNSGQSVADFANTPAASYLSPEQTQPVQNYLEDPEANAPSGPIDAVKSWVSNLFDTSDTWDYEHGGAWQGGDNVAESVWDGFLGGIGWGYDRFNHLNTALISALPGGNRTLTWDEASQVSVGQEFVAAMGASAERAKTGNMQAGDWLLLPATGMSAVLSMIDPNNPAQSAGFDVTNPEMRKAAFEDSGVGKWTTGLLDASFVTFADPLVFAGKGLKLTRLRYLDRPIRNEDDLVRLSNVLNDEVSKITIAGGDAQQISKLDPIVQFAHWVSQKDEQGRKLVNATEIFNHRTIKYSTHRDALATALNNTENYDEAALVLRAAYGDQAARDGLMQVRADLAVEIGDKRREFLRQQLILNPTQRDKMLGDIDKGVKNIDKKIEKLQNQVRDTTAEEAVLRARRSELQDTQETLRNVDLEHLDPLVTPKTRDFAKRAVDTMTYRDRYFREAYMQEADNVSYWLGLRESNAGFSKNNAFGRMVERSRESRATAQYQAAATRGATVVKADGTTRRLHMWESDVFGNNGLSRALRLWRWAGEETPAGYIVTSGGGAQESSRELMAVLNSVNLYSGESKVVTFVKTKIDRATGQRIAVKDKQGRDVLVTQPVGGVQRKQQLLDSYMQTLNDTTLGEQAAKIAIDNIERQIMNDIFAWHGLSPDQAANTLQHINKKRAALIESVRNSGYWVDKINGKDVINKSPWLETHLQNGTFLHNFKEIEKRARLHDETGVVKKSDDMVQFAGEKFMNIYEPFNEVWRPAVLMRLGYTQRNVTEGLFRASAFQFSLDPVGYAAANGMYAIRNAYKKFTTMGAVEKAVEAERVARQTGQAARYPKKFIKWRDAQVAAHDSNLASHAQSVATIAGMLIPQDYNMGMEMRRVLYWEQKRARDAARAAERGGEAEATVGRMYAHADELKSMLDELPIPERGIVATDAQVQALDNAFMTWRNNISYMNDALVRRNMLDNDLQSVSLYMQQGIQKKRMFQNPIQVSDAITFRNAFDPESPYTPIALMMLSADNTTKNMTSLTMDAFNNALKAVEMRTYVAVNPDPEKAAEYFTGVTRALRQFGLSQVGVRVMRGESPESIVRFLMDSPDGQAIAQAVIRGHVKQAGVRNPLPVDAESAAEYVQSLFQRYEQLAPTPDFREYLRNIVSVKDASGRPTALLGGAEEGVYKVGKRKGQPRGSGFNSNIVQQYLGEVGSNGKFVLDLKPVVGNVLVETGEFMKMRELWGKVANAGMKWLGTIPEDMFVRSPFYGKRYEQSVRDGVSIVLGQNPGRDYLTFNEINDIERAAHARALKDTKDWLYTIERRTRLGAAGEIGIPFVSAFQNSVTTLGRLTWRDPSIIPITAKIWNAPAQMGMEDEEGNIVIPIPHDMIPDGVEQALGLENMLNMKIKKSSLNVIMPESGFGFVPRPGPIVGAPVSEIMKHGWFGMSVETPDWLRNVVGDEAANQLWTTWKSYAFGEQGGVSKAPFSLDMFEPPVAAKIQQMLEGEGSSSQYAFYYNAQYRTEVAKYFAGERDDMPTKDEIKTRTNNFYMLRILGNLTAFTPPTYESKIDPLVATVRMYDKQYGSQSAEMFNKNFGNLLLMLGDYSTSKNISGMPATMDAVDAARRYSGLIGKIAPDLKQSGDLSVLSMLVTDNPNSFYDNSAYSWQYTNQIPGVTDYFRELQTPEMSWNESRKNAGWTEYISRIGMLDSLLQQRGLTSYRSAQAADLREMKNQTIEEMRNNPLYQPWYQDYMDHGSIRTTQAIKTMQMALSDPEFYKNHINHEDDKVSIWEAADFYLQQRQMVVDALNQSGKTINSSQNQGIQDYWDGVRNQLIQQVDGWGTFANRFLNGDDDPTNVGVQFGTTYVLDPISAGVSNG